MEIKQDVVELYDRVLSAKAMLKHAKSAEERIALCNYLGNLYEAIKGVGGEDLYPTIKDVFGSDKNLKKFNKKRDILEDRLLRNFLDNKKYHKKLIGSILEEITGPLDKYSITNFSKEEILSKGEFEDIFNTFLSELKLENEFYKYLKDIGIYPCEENEHNYRGYIIYNPTDTKSDIFITNFNYDVQSLFTLAHEVGHAYDFLQFDKDYDAYNKYFYQSFYGETVSKLFERLILNYLIKNNILLGESKEELLAMEFDNYTNMIFSYIISEFDDEILKKNKQDKMSLQEIYSVIEDDFDENIVDILAERDSLGIQENYVYTYGDILSMFLKERVLEDGFNDDMLLELFDRRGEIFTKEFLDKYKVNNKQYVKLYKKEMKLLEK